MKALLIVVFLFLSVALFSQQKYSLEQCIQYALENNIQLKIQELSVMSSKQSSIQSKAAFLPSLNASANQNYSSGRSVDPFTNEFTEQETSRSDNFSLSSSVVLFQGLRNQYTLRQNKFNLLASLNDLDKAKNDLSLNIASAFLQVLLANEVLKAAENAYVQSEKQKNRTQELFNANAIPQSTLLEMEAQYARDELQVTTSRNQYNIAMLTLRQLLDFNDNDPFEIEAPVITSPEVKNALYNTDDIYNLAYKNLPQIAAAENRVKASEAGLNLARGGRSPRLSLSAAYSTGYSDARKSISGSPIFNGFQPSGVGYGTGGDTIIVYSPVYTYDYITRAYNDQIKENANKSLSFNLTIPIFNNWQVNNSIAQAKIGLLNNTYTRDLVSNQLRKEISQAVADARAALSQFEMSKKVYDATSEAYRSSQSRFENGLLNPVEYNLAKTNLDKSESDLIQAKYVLIFREKVLDFYLGNPLKL
jgi:outer membrane protein